MSDEHSASMEMPRYKSHKEIWALKIGAIRESSRADSRLLIPSDSRYGPVVVSVEYMEKHKPEAGGYYVVYSDGYKSFSPAKAFEDGYTAI